MFYIFTVGNLQNIFMKHDLYLIVTISDNLTLYIITENVFCFL